VQFAEPIIQFWLHINLLPAWKVAHGILEVLSRYRAECARGGVCVRGIVAVFVWVQRPDHYKDNDACLKLPRNVTRLAVLACGVDVKEHMAAMRQLRMSLQSPCRQPAILALPRRPDLGGSYTSQASDELRRRQRFSFQYRKSLRSLGFRKLLEKADRAVHRAQPAIQAVAQAEQQVCFSLP